MLALVNPIHYLFMTHFPQDNCEVEFDKNLFEQMIKH